MVLLVGFVNKFYSPELSIGILDVDSGRFAWPSSSGLVEASAESRGVNGICRHRGHWLIGLQSAPTRLLVLDDALGLRRSVELPEIVDLHSIAPYKGDLLTVSTGTDAVYRIRLTDSFELASVRRWWSIGDAPVDAHHLNSVAVCDGNVLLTMFGAKQPGGWSDTKSGRLFEPIGDQDLLAPLHHPHTAYDIGGRWAVCESGSGRVHFEGGRVLEVGGYVRGMAFDDDSIHIGTSGRRLRSRAEGTLNLGVTTATTTSAVHSFDRRSLSLRTTTELDLFGTEIFDLAVASDAVFEAWPSVDAREIQIRSLQQQIYDMTFDGPTSSRSHKILRLGSGLSRRFDPRSASLLGRTARSTRSHRKG